MKFVIWVVPVGFGLIGFLPAFGFLCLWKRKQRQELRESPLARSLLRSPGYSVRNKMSKIYDEITTSIALLVIIPLVSFAIHISQSYLAGEPESALRIVTSVLIGLVVSVVIGRQLVKQLSELKKLCLGLEGELATAEELNQLMLDGCRVFHDIPFPYGNIDHVVVSRSGVFSVNSKMFGKPKSGEGNAEVIVDQTQGIIHFPDRNFRIPTQQFETEANWLKSHLTSAVGRPIDVESILALPGWFVKERIGRGSVYVINPRKSTKFFVNSRQVLSIESVQQVAHQLEQLCRDIEPSFREQRERWEAVK